MSPEQAIRDIADLRASPFTEMVRLDRELGQLLQPTTETTEARVPPDAPLARRYPALDLWRSEVRSGRLGQRADRARSWRFDALWRCACWEAEAFEAEQAGQMGAWRHAMERAREVIAEAVARKAGAA